MISQVKQITTLILIVNYSLYVDPIFVLDSPFLRGMLFKHTEAILLGLCYSILTVSFCSWDSVYGSPRVPPPDRCSPKGPNFTLFRSIFHLPGHCRYLLYLQNLWEAKCLPHSNQFRCQIKSCAFRRFWSSSKTTHSWDAKACHTG